MGVDVGKSTTGTVVDVDSGVKVLRGVDVLVVVGGIASCVRVDAACDVCAMYVLMALGSRVGTGVTTEGAHAMTRTNAMLIRKNFLPVVMSL